MTKEGLDENEKEEKKDLEEKRKAAGDPKTIGQISDSERARLSVLLNKEKEAKEEDKDKNEKDKAAPSATTGSGSGGGSSAPAGKK
jgi:hypothetical protein